MRGAVSELLLEKNMTPNDKLFRFFASKSMDKLNEFDARCLSNLAYAYALVGNVPEFDNGSDLFDHIALEAVAQTKDFKPQEFSNIVWAYTTVNKPHVMLFKKIGDEIVASKQFHLLSS